MKKTIWLVLVAVGALLCLFGLRMAHFFYRFPAIPGFLEVTFWRDTIAFVAVALSGVAMVCAGLVRGLRKTRS